MCLRYRSVTLMGFDERACVCVCATGEPFPKYLAFWL